MVASRRSRSAPAALLAMGVAAVLGVGIAARVPKRPDFSGAWALDRDRSDFPTDLGFNAPWATDITGSSTSSGGGRSRGGGRGGGGGGGSAGGGIGVRALPSGEESGQTFDIADDLVAEVRDPPVSLVIAQTDVTLTLAGPDGHARIFHTDGRSEVQQLQHAPVSTKTTWNHNQVVIDFIVEKGRSVRYTYGLLADGSLQVQVRFIEPNGGKDVITRVYRRGGSGPA